MTSSIGAAPATSTASPSRPPAPIALDPAHKRVGFVARHLMVSKVRGSFNEATATIIVAEDPLQSQSRPPSRPRASTPAQADRDSHLRSADFLDAEKFPTLSSGAPGSSPIAATSSCSSAT